MKYLRDIKYRIIDEILTFELLYEILIYLDGRFQESI